MIWLDSKNVNMASECAAAAAAVVFRACLVMSVSVSLDAGFRTL